MVAFEIDVVGPGVAVPYCGARLRWSINPSIW
jgi:hypothetical protein